MRKVVTFAFVVFSFGFADIGAGNVVLAAPAMQGGAALPAGEPLPFEPAQFRWQGRPYCWYFDAWRGPGWYQCGFAWRRGYGWGGGYGWRGWQVPGWRGPGWDRRWDRRRDWRDERRRQDRRDLDRRRSRERRGERT